MTHKMIVMLEWEGKLGPTWMDIDNLKLCLYGADNTKPELLRVTDVTGKVQKAYLASHTGANILKEALDESGDNNPTRVPGISGPSE